jgi:hypothetical protein
MHEIFFENLRNPVRGHRAGVMRQFPTLNLTVVLSKFTEFRILITAPLGFAEALLVFVTQKLSVSKILEVISTPEFCQGNESGLRSDRGPVSSSM